jgi:hypothetical protein
VTIVCEENVFVFGFITGRALNVVVSVLPEDQEFEQSTVKNSVW